MKSPCKCGDTECSKWHFLCRTDERATVEKIKLYLKNRPEHKEMVINYAMGSLSSYGRSLL